MHALPIPARGMVSFDSRSRQLFIDAKTLGAREKGVKEPSGISDVQRVLCNDFEW